MAGFVVGIGAMNWALHGLPLDHPLDEPHHPTILLQAADGAPLGRLGPLRLAHASLQDYPPILMKAVLSTEDRRFYDHFGIDPKGILRAAQWNLAVGRIVEGGSTITQQLVKLQYLGGDRTYIRKLREALVAIWLETHLSKDEILTRYLDQVYLGGGAYGMSAAAQLYFDKRPADLTLPESAMLAGLIKGPSEFSPLDHLEAAQHRAAVVLDDMVATGAITAEAANAAKANPATLKLSPRLKQAGSWFTDWVAPQAEAAAGSDTGNVRVRTTLQPNLQRLAQNILNQTLAKEGRRRGVTEGALVAMRPDGSVLAMVGGRNYGASQFNRAVDASRQPGSAFKLFVYLAALRDGYLPDDVIDAQPVNVKGWEPANYGGERYGRITLADAFARSVNTAAVRLAMKVGLDHVIDAARDLGITTPLPPVPSMALGTDGVNLLELTGAFASVRADRMHVEPWGISAAGPTDGMPMRAIGPPQTAAQTLDPYRQPLLELLQGVVEHGTGRRASLDDGFAAGKTGTSQDYRDAWFVGFNDSLVVGVWLGNDNDAPMRRVVGGGLPASIWRQFVIEATPLVAPTVIAGAAAAGAADNASESEHSETSADGAAQAGGGRQCDVPACASVYHSFRASDCSYQPYFGPRRACELGGEPGKIQWKRADMPFPPVDTEGGLRAQCDVEACARDYSSFDPSDCTYQPYDGRARQVCER